MPAKVLCIGRSPEGSSNEIRGEFKNLLDGTLFAEALAARIHRDFAADSPVIIEQTAPMVWWIHSVKDDRVMKFNYHIVVSQE